MRHNLIALSLVCLASSALAHPFGDSLVVVISGGMRGRADGCGCSSGPQGGLDRRATLLKELVSDAPFFALDCGGILDLDPAGGMARSRCTIAGLARQGLRVIGVGARDLFYGAPFLKTSAAAAGVELVSANILGASFSDARLFSEWSVIEHSGVTIAVTAISTGSQPKFGAEPAGWSALPPDSVIAELLATKPAPASLTILLTDLDEATLRRLLNQTALFDLAITSSRQVYSATPFKVKDCLVYHPEPDGRSLEAAILPYSGPAEQARFVRLPITTRTAADDETSAWLKSCLGEQSPTKSKE